jgi:hypothetical protein
VEAFLTDLFDIIAIQAENAKDIPLSPHTQVDMHFREWGYRRPTKSKALEKAKKDYKEANKKVRQGIFKYNSEGIAKYGKAWIHMNASEKLARYKELLMSDSRMPPPVIEWAIKRGYMNEPD